MCHLMASCRGPGEKFCMCLDGCCLKHIGVACVRGAAPSLWRRFGHGAPAAKPGSVVPFLLADIGEGIAEVEIIQWFKKEVSVVKKDGSVGNSLGRGLLSLLA
jgi:hypothetical protein